jgi:transcriptional regulator with XRE-family HTH domain
MHSCTALELRKVAFDDCRVHSGERIKRAREEAKLGQRDVAEALDVSVSTVSNWERGKTVPRSRLGALRKLLSLTDEDVAEDEVSRGEPSLGDATDMELAMEFFRRLQDAKAVRRLPVGDELSPIPEDYIRMEGKPPEVAPRLLPEGGYEDNELRRHLNE